MRNLLTPIVASVIALITSPVMAAEPATKPVRMGSGNMTFNTVPGWGLLPDGSSALGPTHGGVAIDKAGNIFVTAQKKIVVFSPEGRVINEMEGKHFTQLHDIKIREEDGVEYVYGARNEAGQGIKFNAQTGEIAIELPFPKESGLDLKKFNPTAIAVAANGDIYLSDGYASDHIFKFDKTGKYAMHFGAQGDGLEQFHTAHGMTIDTRYDPPRLLICDRNHGPKGRLLHYDLDGKFIGEVVTGLGMPTSANVQGDYVSVPDLHGRVVILNKDNVICAVLGYNPDPAQRMNFGVPQEKWIEGVFSGTHGSCWDKDGNLYVADWNVAGRIMKLVKVK